MVVSTCLRRSLPNRFECSIQLDIDVYSCSSLAKPGSDAFQQAVEAVRLQQMSVRQVAEHYGCAATPLFNHTRGSVKKAVAGDLPF